MSSINSLLTQYAYSVNSMFCTFPTQAIAAVLDKHAASLAKKQVLSIEALCMSCLVGDNCYAASRRGLVLHLSLWVDASI